MKLLQVSAEYYGLAKTGGLADMVASLTTTLAQNPTASVSDLNVRSCIPAYPGTQDKLQNVHQQGSITVHGHCFRVLLGTLPGHNHPMILLDCPELFHRAGDPYRDTAGREFSDNGWRFGCFNKAVARLALEGVGGWQPDLVHLHDWHLGLAAALVAHPELVLSHETLPKHSSRKIKTVFTIHNFSFHGIFDRQLFDALGLPDHWWHHQQLEFYGHFSFMKAALLHADAITAVSPRYAREIATEEFGSGLQGLVAEQAHKLYGIVNGIDEKDWDPATDELIASPYSARNVSSGKKANKAELQKSLGLPVKDVPLVIFIGRFADQKGADLIMEARPHIEKLPVQMVVLGSGDHTLEQGFADWAKQRPQQVAAVIDVSETMAHRMTAAADIQLMPSRFEPCGLSQMYAQRYGTFPLARATGGLADTITPANSQNSEDATGFLFQRVDVGELVDALQQALLLLEDKQTTRKMRQTAMKRDFSWSSSAEAYLQLYNKLLSSGSASSGNDHQKTGSARNRPENTPPAGKPSAKLTRPVATAMASID